ncbi:MAG: AtpZ/AtpI family protein [Planctomycetota bacterium]
MSNQETPDRPPSSSGRWAAGAGLELAATMGGACLLGWWIDRKFDTEPWGMVVCAVIGIVGGLYNLIRRSVRDMLRQNRRKSGRRPDCPGDDTGA